MQQNCEFGAASYDTCCSDTNGNSMNINMACMESSAVDKILSYLNTSKEVGIVHGEPKTPGQYKLVVNHDSSEKVIRDYRCYMGQTGYPDPAQLYTQTGFSRLFARSYYWEEGQPPVTLNSLIHNEPKIPWLTDPTVGMQRYDYGCAYISDLVTPRDDGKEGFSIKTIKRPTVGGYEWNNADGGGADSEELYSIRLHSKDQFNGGFIVISLTKAPYGAAAWPAFWMVGNDPNVWNFNKPKNPGLALTNNWPVRGEIDIVEYINSYTEEQKALKERNHITLHTVPNCYSYRTSPNGQGKIDTKQRNNAGLENINITGQGGDDCNYQKAFEGCGTSQKPYSTPGPWMEAHGGGIYAIEWVKGKFIKGYHWYKDDSRNPFEYFKNTETIDMNYLHNIFGLPDIKHDFETTCTIPEFLSDMFMIFNTAVCGDWAGNLDGTRLQEDPSGISYEKKVYPDEETGSPGDGFRYPRCESAVRERLRQSDYEEFLKERFQWDVDFVKVFT